MPFGLDLHNNTDHRFAPGYTTGQRVVGMLGRIASGFLLGPGGSKLYQLGQNAWNNAHNPYAYTGSTPSTTTYGSGMTYTAPTNAGGNWMNGYGAGSYPGGFTAAPGGGVNVPSQFDTNFSYPGSVNMGGDYTPGSTPDDISRIPIPSAGGVQPPNIGINSKFGNVKVGSGYQGSGSATPAAQGTLDPMLWGQALANAWDYSAQDAMGNVNSTFKRG